jgi:hypothetical protein
MVGLLDEPEELEELEEVDELLEFEEPDVDPPPQPASVNKAIRTAVQLMVLIM